MKRNCSEKSETSKKKVAAGKQLEKKKKFVEPYLDTTDSDEFYFLYLSSPQKVKKNGKICPKNHFWNNGFCVWLLLWWCNTYFAPIK